MISLALKDYGVDHAVVAQSSNGETNRSIAPPLTSADRGRRAGDLPSAWVDPRWLRSYLPTVNARAKHLVRNNRHAATAARKIPNQIVGSGIHPVLTDPMRAIWRRWSTRRRRINTTARLDWHGLQELVARARLVTGEAFIVLTRLRMGTVPTDTVPVRIEVFDADGLSEAPARGVQPRNYFDFGREIGPSGRTVAWHFRIDAGLHDRYVRVSASDVVHVYDPDDCASRRGISAFSPVVIDIHELAGYQDSTAVKQHLASKLTLITTDPNTMASGAGVIDDLAPGAQINIESGREAKAFEAPLVREYRDFVKSNRDEIAVCLGTTPEALSGDYSGMSWTVARASYLAHWEDLRGHRDRWLRPACEDVYDWVRWAMGGRQSGWPEVDEMDWQSPVQRAIDPDREGLANQRLVRNGFKSWSDVAREGGRDPDRLLQEMAEERAKMTGLGLVLDSDPSMTTQQGQEQLPSERDAKNSDS